MIIPINVFLSEADSVTHKAKLPSRLVKLGSDELILIELQGDIETEGEKKGQEVGTLTLDDKVCTGSVPILCAWGAKLNSLSS
jgi:chromosome transmission fidelity protein 8